MFLSSSVHQLEFRDIKLLGNSPPPIGRFKARANMAALVKSNGLGFLFSRLAH